MTKRGLIVATIIGLAFAVAAAVVIDRAALQQSIDLIVLVLDVLAGGIAGRAILGVRRVHRYFALGLVVLSGASALISTSAVTNYLINQSVTFGRPAPTPDGRVVVTVIIAFVVYLVAATIYGFAAAKQGVRGGARIGLLLLLLLAVIPALNVLGLLGFVIASAVRAPKASPEPALASD
jgi:hypothetical protein